MIDISGSMGLGDRIQMAQDAVSAVIDTLSWSDHAALVLFDDVTTVYQPLDGSGAMA